MGFRLGVAGRFIVEVLKTLHFPFEDIMAEGVGFEPTRVVKT